MKKKQEIEIPFFLAIIPLIAMIGMMAVTIIKFEGSPHIPLAVGSIIAGIIAWRLSAINGKRLKRGRTKAFVWRCRQY